MAARVTKIRHDENTRAKIKAGNIITRLQNYIEGKVKMEAAQVTAALGLLKKSLPDLTSVEHSGEIKKTYVARMPPKQTSLEQWQNNYTAPTTTTRQ